MRFQRSFPTCIRGIIRMMELRRLRLLHELTRRGTIAAVAEALAYSPSSVSVQLAELEREAGASLLEPDGRDLQRTAGGERGAAGGGARAAARAPRALAAVEALLAELPRRGRDAQPEGTLRVTSTQTTALGLLP